MATVLNVTYEQGDSTDIKIILYGKDFEEDSSDLLAGGLIEIGNLVRRNNKCCVTTYLVKGISCDHKGKKITDLCSIEEGPDDVLISDRQILPSKRQVQEAEFWTGYYFPQWATDPIGIDDNIIDIWAPGYFLGKDFRTEASWNDEGFFIKLISKQGADAIQWIWDSIKSEFEKKYPTCPIIIEEIDEKPFAISVRIIDIPMTDLINMPPNDKSYYGEYVFDQEHNFQEVANYVVEDYNDTMKALRAA